MSIASQQLGKTLFLQQESCLHDSKKNKTIRLSASSQYAKSYLKGIHLPGRAVYYWKSTVTIRLPGGSTVQNETVRIRLPGGSTVQNETGDRRRGSAVQCSAVQCSAVQNRARQWGFVCQEAVQYETRQWGFVCQEAVQNETVRIRLWDRTERVQRGFICQEAVQYGTRSSREWVQRLRYCGRNNITGEGITKKNPWVRIQNREDEVFSLSGARLCNK
jgi:hypothetical protein